MYIERSYLREQKGEDSDDGEYFRLVPNRIFLLGAKGVVRHTAFTKDPSSLLITELQCILEDDTQ